MLSRFISLYWSSFGLIYKPRSEIQFSNPRATPQTCISLGLED